MRPHDESYETRGGWITKIQPPLLLLLITHHCIHDPRAIGTNGERSYLGRHRHFRRYDHTSAWLQASVYMGRWKHFRFQKSLGVIASLHRRAQTTLKPGAARENANAGAA
jgi:hypothetical protein